MRKNLVSFLLRLAIVTFLLTGGQLTQALGHDLPSYFPYHELGADCLGVRLPAANAQFAIPAVNPPPPVAQPLAQQVPPQGAAQGVAPNGLQGKQPAKLQMTNPSSLLALGLAYSDTVRQAFNQAGFAQLAKQQLSSLTAWLEHVDFDAINALNCEMARSDIATIEVVDAAKRPTLFAALPDDVRAPAPATVPARATTIPPAFSATVTNLVESVELVERVKHNYLEDYLPYDLCISDWQFGQYSYRGLSRMAHLQQPRAEVSHAAQMELHPAPVHQAAKPTAESLAHGEILRAALSRFNDLQCLLYSEFCGFDSAYELGVLSAKAQHGLRQQAASHAIELAIALGPAQCQPFYTEPIYVAYELDGKLLLIPAEQAREWTALRAALHPTAANGVMVAQSIRQKVLSLASQQLTGIGNRLLDAASTLESFSGTKVARTNEQDVR